MKLHFSCHPVVLSNLCECDVLSVCTRWIAACYTEWEETAVDGSTGVNSCSEGEKKLNFSLLYLLIAVII